jgi:hypothetical protein
MKATLQYSILRYMLWYNFDPENWNDTEKISMTPVQG